MQEGSRISFLAILVQTLADRRLRAFITDYYL